MADPLARTWYYTIDPELRLIHAFKNCTAAKVAVRYNYSYEFSMKVGDREAAAKLDGLLRGGYLCCHTCYKREAGLSKKDARMPRPGFMKEPERR